MRPAWSAAIVFHAFNGLRLILVDFWKQGPKYQRQMLWGVIGLWVIAMSVPHPPPLARLSGVTKPWHHD